MKKSLILFAAAAFAFASCGNKTDGAAGSGDSTNADSTEVAEAAGADDNYNDFPWDFPKDIEIPEMEADQYYLAPYTSYPNAVKEKKDLTEQVLIFYSDKYKETVDGKVNGNTPTSLCIPLPNGETAKKGDILLTWWQSGSGLERAYVIGGTAEEPKVVYLDLNYTGDGTGFAEKESNINDLKPNSFKVLTDGKLEPGAPIVYNEDGKWKTGTCVNVADGKVILIGFASHVYAVKEADVKVIPLKPQYKVGDSVMAKFVDTMADGYKVTKIDESCGRVWVEKNGREEPKAIIEVCKPL